MESFFKFLPNPLDSVSSLLSLFLNHCVKDYMRFQISGGSFTNITVFSHKINELLSKFNLPFLFHCISIDKADLEPRSAKINIYGVEVTLVPRAEYVYQEEDEDSNPLNNAESESHTIPGYYDPTASVPQDILKSLIQKLDINIIDITIRFEGTKSSSSTGIASEIKIQTLRLFNKHPDRNTFESTEFSRCIQVAEIIVYTDETKIDTPKLSNDDSLAESISCSDKRIVQSMHPIRIATMHNMLELDFHIDLITRSISLNSVVFPDIAFIITTRQIDLLSKLVSMFLDSPVITRNDSPTEIEDSNDLTDTQSVVSGITSLASGSGMAGWSQSFAKEMGTSRKKSHSESMLYCSSEAGGSEYAQSAVTGATSVSRMTDYRPRKCASLDLAEFVDKFTDFELKNLEMNLLINSIVGVVLHEDVLIEGGSATYAEMNNISRTFLVEVNEMDLTSDHEEEDYNQIKHIEDMMISLQKISQKCCRKNHFQLTSFNIGSNMHYQLSDSNYNTIIKASIGEMKIYENICDGLPLNKDRQDTTIELVSFFKSEFSTDPCIGIDYESSLNFEDLNYQILDQKVEVTVHECSIEVDLSVLNRIDAFFIEKSFFNEEYAGMSSSFLNETKEHQMEISPSNIVTNLTCTCFFPNVRAKLRFPVPDFNILSQSSNWNRNIRNDILTFHFFGLQFGFIHSHLTPANKLKYHMEAKSFHLLFQESADSSEYMIVSTKTHEKYLKATIRIGSLPVRKMLSKKSSHRLAEPVGPFKKSNFTNSSFNNDENTLMYPTNRECFRRVLEEGYDDVKLHITVEVAHLSLNIPSKHIYEVLYNRLAYDLTLFELHHGHPLRTVKQKPQTATNPTETFSLDNFGMNESIYHSCLIDTESVPASSDDAIGDFGETMSEERSTSTALGIEVKVSSVDILINTPFRDPVSNLPRKDYVGKLCLTCHDVLLQCAVAFKGDNNKTYLGIHVADGTLEHSPKSKDPYNAFHGDTICFMKGPKEIFPTLRESLSQNSSQLSDLISLVIDFDFDLVRNASTMTMALCLMNALYEHDIKPHPPLWYSQLVDTFTVDDYPISGYEIPQTINNIQVSALESALTYVADDLKTELTMYLDNLMLGISMSYECDVCSFSFLLEDMKISLMKSGPYPDLNTRVCVFQIPCLELLYKKSYASLKKKGGDPINDIHLIASKVKFTIHIDTLVEMILISDHIFSIMSEGLNDISISRNSSPDLNVSSGRSRCRKDSSCSQVNMKDLQLAVHDLAASSLSAPSESTKLEDDRCSTFAFHDDRDKPIPIKESDSKVTYKNESFSLVELSEPPKPQIKINHFAKWISEPTPLSRNGLLKSMDTPELRLRLKDIGVHIDICHGSALTPDYESKSVGAVSCSTRNVRIDVASMSPFSKNEYMAYIKIHLKRMNFTVEQYPEENTLSKNISFSIGDMEVQDNVPASKLLKLVQRYNPPDSPAPSNVKFASIKCRIEKTFDDSPIQEEASLALSLSSIRMYIDQAAVSFIMDFVNSLQEMYTNNNPATNDFQKLDLMEEEISEECEYPLYFKSIIFHPSVDIVIDFEGNFAKIKSFNEFIASWFSSKNIKLTLKAIKFKKGIPGITKVLNFLFDEWTTDITGSQMIHQSKNLLTPVQDVLQFANGFLQFFITPYHTYQKDGSILKGIVIGSRELGSHSFSATFNLLVKFLGVVESISAFFFMIVSNSRKREAISGPRPQTIREGVGVTAEVARDAYCNIVEGVFSGQDAGERGYTGVVSAGLRQIPAIVTAGPYIAMTATTNIASGVQNQILPGTSEDVQNKYK